MNSKRTNSGIPGATDGRIITGPANDGPSNAGPVDAGASAADCGSRGASPSAKDLHVQRILSESPKTSGQQLNEAWQSGAVEHPSVRAGGTFRMG